VQIADTMVEVRIPEDRGVDVILELCTRTLGIPGRCLAGELAPAVRGRRGLDAESVQASAALTWFSHAQFNLEI